MFHLSRKFFITLFSVFFLLGFFVAYGEKITPIKHIETIEGVAANKLISRAQKNNIPLPHLRDKMMTLFHTLKNKEKKMIIGTINGFIEEQIEEKYHIPVWYEIHGKTAYMFGKISTGIEKTTRQLLRDYPNIKIIKPIYVPGSLNDFENFKTIHFLRKHGIIIYLPHDGYVASGGVDFLFSGRWRIIERGARVATHSRRYDGISDANSLPKDDPHHAVWLDFYKSINISTEYYWFVISHATANEIHRMTENELIQYGFVKNIKQ